MVDFLNAYQNQITDKNIALIADRWLKPPSESDIEHITGIFKKLFTKPEVIGNAVEQELMKRKARTIRQRRILRLASYYTTIYTGLRPKTSVVVSIAWGL